MKKGLICYYCGQAIKFNRRIRSPTGKFIPLNEDGTKHDCPKSPYKSNQEKEMALPIERKGLK